MFTSVPEYVQFLRGSDALLGVPFLLFGFSLMVFGWRLWRVSVAIAFALAGYVGGVMLGQGGQQEMIYGLLGAGAMLLVTFVPRKAAIPLVGGVACAMAAVWIARGAGFDGWPMLVAAGLGLLAGGGASMINRAHVIVLVTAIEGAIFLVSGLVCMSNAAPWTYNIVKGMSSGSAIVVPFVLLVPAVVSFFYQEGEVRRTNTEL